MTDNFNLHTVALSTVAFWQMMPHCKHHYNLPSNKYVQLYYIILQEVLVCLWSSSVTPDYFFQLFCPLWYLLFLSPAL